MHTFSIPLRSDVIIYHEWPHRQGGCLACWRLQIWSIPSGGCTYYIILCTRRSGGTINDRGDKTSKTMQSIGSTVSDSIVRSWLWSSATWSTPLRYFSRLPQVASSAGRLLHGHRKLFLLIFYLNQTISHRKYDHKFK